MENKEIENTADQDFIIITTTTIDKLFNINPDAVSLYIFYIKTSKWQKTNKVFTTNTYGMKSLSWGAKRYSDAKKILEDEGLINISQKRDDKGRIVGWYIKINYLFKQETIQNISKQLLVTATSGEKETDALSNNTEDALSNNTYNHPLDLDKPKQDPIGLLPERFGKNPILRLARVYKAFWLVKMKTPKKEFNYARFGRAMNVLLQNHSEIQISALMDSFFDWEGPANDNPKDNIFLQGTSFRFESLVSMSDVITAFIKNYLKKDYDNPEKIREFVKKQLINKNVT